MTSDTGMGENTTLSPEDVFAVLGDETRLQILQTLGDADESLAFSELFDRVDYDSTANFSYHLEKLDGHFVRRTDDGYALRFAGEQVVRAILAGTLTEDLSLPPETIDDRCVYCGSSLKMAYDEGIISVRCTGCDGVVRGSFPRGTLVYFGFPPAGLHGRSREAAVDAAHVLYDSKITPMMKGICPECAGQIALSYDICSDHELDGSGLCPNCDARLRVWSVYECEHCTYRRRAAMWFAALTHPAVISFCYDHGLEETIPFRKLTWDNARFVEDITEAVVDTDPYRFRVTISVEGDDLVVELNEELDVIDVTS